MNAAPDATRCPRCGEIVQDTTGIGGVCAICFAAAALDDDTGWLVSPSGDDDKDSAWPSLLGWTITGILGAGGMGRVYRAESVKDGAPGALKVLDGKWSRDPLMAARFEAEAHALKKLRHENIVRVIETGETDDGRFCIVMELVEGCDLGRLLRAEKLPPERAVEIFQKVCSAVACAHEQGFAHRDIKPANILVARDGTVKLVDFGLAKDLGQDTGPSIGALTATTDHFGTAYYLAPERILSRKNAGPLADIYALGVLLYHVLTGQMPLGKYTPASQLTGLPAAFDVIIGRALEADPARRTESVREMSEAVAKTWSDHITGAYRARKRRRVIAIIATATLLVLTAAGGALWQYQRMKPPPPPVFANPATASQAAPWENSLGMQFVPVPGTRVLFSIWETRRKDVEPQIHELHEQLEKSWRADLLDKIRSDTDNFAMFALGGRIVLAASWENPGFPVTPDHPVGFVSIREAQRFCQWLTFREQKEGRLATHQRYRLPTNAEWLTACGGEKAALRPGNVAGQEARDDRWPPAWPTLDTRDDYPRSAPVGSFPVELHGLYDISGNVSEWVLDQDESSVAPIKESKAVLRGPNFLSHAGSRPEFANAMSLTELRRWPNLGFRVVLDYQGEATEE